MRNIRNGDYMLRKLEDEIVKECAPTLAVPEALSMHICGR